MDAYYMKRAVTLAEKARGNTSPDPLAGAVIVKEGKIIGEGYRQFCGDLPAEIKAIRELKTSARGATLFMTLEPGSREIRDFDNLNAILHAEIARVVIGTSNPDLDTLSAAERLAKAGLEVTEGVLKAECDRINEVFLHYQRTKRPFVFLKCVSTLDGKSATFTGQSQWITGEEVRQHAHEMRNQVSAVMTGIGTVLRDNPRLTCRIPDGKSPLRIICDSSLSIPLESKIVKTASEFPTLIACTRFDPKKARLLEDRDCKVVAVREKDGRVDLADLMDLLGEIQVDSLLIEGGGSLNWSALEDQIVNRIQIYYAKKIFGGKEAKTTVEGQGIPFPNLAYRIVRTRILPLGDDFLLEGEVSYDGSSSF